VTFLAAAREQIYGRLVDDGQIAIGALVALLACAAVSALAGTLGSQALCNSAGPLLLVALMTLLLVNLYTTGRKACARRTGR
jgi:hypothetical protein